MKIILHRINKREVLRSTPQEFGVEVDIRSYGDDLVIHHEPFLKGELFNEWIEDFNHGTLILNVKEDATTEEIILAHKIAMQKYHPDKGGSDYMARKINSAKDKLLS